MDKLKQMESFVAVATRGSLTAAARAEGVAPAIMGRRLDALEERLGVKLLLRTTRRLSLTHEGSAFLEDCQRLLADIANAEAGVSAGGVKASGHLRVTAPAGFGRRHVAPLVPRFRELHKDVTISLNLSDRVVDMAREGYDCAVRVGDLPDSSLVSVRLADNRRLCVATPEYLKHHGTPQTPQDLARFDCLVLSSEASQTRGWAFRVPCKPPGLHPEEPSERPEVLGVLGETASLELDLDPAQAEGDAVLSADLAGAGLVDTPLVNGAQTEGELIYYRPQGPLDCSDGQVLHDWCLAGYGIAWRSTWEVEEDVSAGRLVPVLEDYAAPPNGIYAVFPQRKHLPLRLRLWLDFLRHHYGQPAFWQSRR